MIDLKAKLGFKPLCKRRALVVSSEDMEPAKFHLMRKAIGVEEGVIKYARNNERDFVKRFEDENVKGSFCKVVLIQCT